MTEQITLQKALFTIKKLKQLLQNQKAEPIAITGLSCRFPSAVGKQAYWQMLCEGRNIISRMPEKRWELLKGSDEVDLRDLEHPYYGGFLSDIAAFDAYFFGISPREAQRMDPQHRFMLEVAYEAIEDAGLSVDSIAGTKTGIFASLYVSQLAHLQTMDNEMDALYLPTGNAIAIAANRISYLLDLRGPSVIIDSACSSSMASLYLACLNLQNKNCDMALVCGAKMNLLPYVNFVLTKAKMLSPDGQCKTFDASANGYVQGEGVGVIVLKPLSKALEDKDRIYAVITGSAVNQDGRTNGLTAPNGLQQEALLKAAYSSANVDPHEISYVECHGTGTFLGDPIEIQALGEVIGKKRDGANPCWIGSVKTNIGHLEPAAGIASIIKVALALHHSKIPPHLNFQTPNPHIAFDKYHLQIPKQVENWPKYGNYRIAGLSGFGFGGTNAHIVMREITDQEKPATIAEAEIKPELFTLSAKDPAALKQTIENWLGFLENNSSLPLAQICYLTHLRRSHYNHRIAVISNSLSDLKTKLQTLKVNGIQNSVDIYVSAEKGKTAVTPKNISDLDLKALAEVYINHTNINWKEYETNRSFPHLDLPLYPWQQKDYWPPLGHKLKNNNTVETKENNYPLQAQQIFSPLPTLQFEFQIDDKHIPELQDTYNILHAGYYLEILSYAVTKLSQQNQFTVEDHEFLSPLIVPNKTHLTVQLILEKLSNESFNFHFYSLAKGQQNWVEHARGKLFLQAHSAKKLDTIDVIINRCSINETAEKLYERVIAMGMPAGESIRWTHQYWKNDKEILCEFKQPKFADKNDVFSLKIHPGIFDACIQPIFKLFPDNLMKPYIASSAKRLKFMGMKKGPFYLLGQLNDMKSSGEKMSGELWLLNADNEIIAEFENINLTQLDNKIQIDQIMQAKEKHEKLDLSNLPPEERKEHIIQFLVEQVAIIFSMPKQDIEINRSLRDMGIDSLMALVLMRTLEVGLGATYSMQSLLEGPTITELADFVINTTFTKADIVSKPSHPWIAYRQPQSEAQLRLFCFPYGGGGASIYRDWQKNLPNTIELCPIQLPGREDRMHEKPIGSMDILLDQLIENLQHDFNLPFAFFGHSFGSLIGFELARKLSHLNLPTPKHLFVSAFPDPRTPTRSLDNLLKQLQTINISLSDIDNLVAVERLSDQQLVQLSDIFSENGIADYGDHLMNRDVIKVLLPIFIGDMGIVKSYQYKDESPLNIPITVFLGKRDTWVAYEDHLKWIEHTKLKCEIHEFDSGHLFIKDNQIKTQILQKIAAILIMSKTKEEYA